MNSSKPVYVTGNALKAKYFNTMLGIDLENVAVELDEIQSLDLREVVAHKARGAYEKLRRPVVVEDTKLVFPALGALPGPLIKWFLEELKPEGLCRLIDGKDRSAIAGAAMAYYDGQTLEIFERELLGSVSSQAKGDTGFGWNCIFIPEGGTLTIGEMSEAEFLKVYKKVKPFDELASYMNSLDK